MSEYLQILQHLEQAFYITIKSKLFHAFLGGYKNLSSAFRRCRDCLATFDDTQKLVSYEIVVYIFQ